MIAIGIVPIDLPNGQNLLEPALDPQFSTTLDPEVPE